MNNKHIGKYIRTRKNKDTGLKSIIDLKESNQLSFPQRLEMTMLCMICKSSCMERWMIYREYQVSVFQYQVYKARLREHIARLVERFNMRS